MNTSKYLVEFLGVFFLVLTIGLTVVEPGGAGTLAPFAIVAVLVALIYAGGHISAAHYNPAVTIALRLRGTCAAQDVVPYIIAQTLAAVLAGALTLFLKPGAVIEPHVVTLAPVLICEFLFTFAMTFVILNVGTSKSIAGNSFYGIAIGLVVLAGIFAVGPISGCVLNPGVATGMVVMGLLKASDAWIYLAGQFAGAVAAALAFKSLIPASIRG
jgi:aquaporin Z